MANGINGKKWTIILPAGVLIALLITVVAAGRQYGQDQQRLEDVTKRVDTLEGQTTTLTKIGTDIATMQSDIRWIKEGMDREHDPRH